MPALIICVACNLSHVDSSMSASPEPSPTQRIYRDITIDVLSGEGESDFFEIGDIRTNRDREGFHIWSHQSHFWRPGDEFNAGSLDIEMIFDDLAPYTPFFFWPNGSLQEIYDDDGKPNGVFLATGMTISPSTVDLALGEHTMTIRVANPHDEVFEHTWRFVIRERETPQIPAPLAIVPTAEYLRESPQPTLEFVRNPSIEAKHLDRINGSWIGTREAICFTLDDSSFVPPELEDDAFRSAMWDEINLKIDGVEVDIRSLPNDNVRVRIWCTDSDYLDEGVHLAHLSVSVGGEEYSYMWAFTIE